MKADRGLIVRIEQLSFESMGVYMDVEKHDGYIDVSVDSSERKIALTEDDWKIIDKKVRELFKQD
jgi:hypothetical protein